MGAKTPDMPLKFKEGSLINDFNQIMDYLDHLPLPSHKFIRGIIISSRSPFLINIGHHNLNDPLSPLKPIQI